MLLFFGFWFGLAWLGLVCCRILLVVDPGADSILMEVRKAVNDSHDDVYEFELKALEALLSVSSKRLVSQRDFFGGGNRTDPKRIKTTKKNRESCTAQVTLVLTLRLY